jgi:hypothetical protein
MIIEFLLAMVFGIIEDLLNLLPNLTFPTEGFTSAFSTISGVLSLAGYFMPLDTLGIVLSIGLSFYGFQFLVSLTNWLIRKIPSIS